MCAAARGRGGTVSTEAPNSTGKGRGRQAHGQDEGSGKGMERAGATREDLAHAKIFVTIYNSTEEEGKVQIKQLAEYKKFIRSILAKRLRMRSVPDLHFFEDKSIIEGMRISNLVSQTIAKDESKRDQDDSQEQE